MYDHHHVNMSRTWHKLYEHVSSKLQHRSADKTSHRLSFLKCFSSPLQLLRPLFFLFSIFIIAPQRKIYLDEKRSKKQGKREWKKLHIFQKTHQHTTLKSHYPPFGSEALWDWKQWSRGQPPAESALCPKEGHMGAEGPQKGQGGPPDHRPREAPHTLAAKGQWGPGRERERGRRRVKESRRGLPGIG